MLPKNQIPGEMKPFSSIDDPLKPSAVNKVIYNTDSDHVDAQWMLPDNCPYNQCKTHSNSWPVPKPSWPVPKSSILIPGNVQIQRQVPLSDAKRLKEKKIALYDLLQKYVTIISRSNKDIGRTDLIKMYIATRPNASPIATQLYPLALKHHNFLKQEIKNLPDAGIIHKSISPWVNPIVVVKKHMPNGVLQSSTFA